jgi:hypothetical protein
MGEWEVSERIPSENPNAWEVENRIPSSPPASVVQNPSPGFWGRAVNTVKGAAEELTTPIEGNSLWETIPKIGEKIINSIVGPAGRIAGDAMMTTAKMAYEYGVSPTTQKANRNTLAYLANTDIGKAQQQTFSDVGKVWTGLEEEYPRATKLAESGAEGLNLIPAYQIAKGAAKVLPAMGRGAVDMVYPSLDPEGALKQVIKPRGRDPVVRETQLAKGERALSSLNLTEGDLKNITFEDLSNRMKAKVPELAKQVDAELMVDPKPYSIDELVTVSKTKGGADVSVNYVQTALDNLEELYTKINDPVRAGNVKELIAKAETEGLTKKEVNDLAREYGVEFRAKAFSQGNPLTSVNDQAYENVRSGLKEVARRGLSDTAKELDGTMSDIMSTKTLIDKNYAAADNLKIVQKQRGVGEKASKLVLQALDVATLGTVKGALVKMLPRGMGLKVNNFMELEEALGKNLKIILDETKRLDNIAANKVVAPSMPMEAPVIPEQPPESVIGPRVDPNEIDKMIQTDRVEKGMSGILRDAQRASQPALPPGQGFEVVGPRARGVGWEELEPMAGNVDRAKYRDTGIPKRLRDFKESVRLDEIKKAQDDAFYESIGGGYAQ